MAKYPKHAITSFTEEGYATYGKRFLEAFEQFWPLDCVIYYEGPKPPEYLKELSHPPFKFQALDRLARWKSYEAKIAQFPIMQGRVDQEYYTIRYDARMARKTFMQAHACETFGGKVFWVDADTFTFTALPESLFDEVLPDDKLCCFLGRDGGPIPYTESGFIGFNALHPQCASFMAAYQAFFEQGLIFTCPGWHDCFGFDTVRRSFPKEIFVDLGWGSGVQHPHVFINSILGKFMDHNKGNRKVVGHSDPAKDLAEPRQEEYWKNLA